MKIFRIDNNDSFTNNLEQLLFKEINHAEVTVVSYFEILPCFVKADCEQNKKPLNLDEFDLIVISPGPGKPQDYPGKTMNRMDYLNAWQTAHDSGFDHVFALNTLGGMIPVSTIGDVVFDTEHETARKITDIILELN